MQPPRGYSGTTASTGESAAQPMLDGEMEPKYYRGWHLAKNDFEYKTTEFEWSLIRFYEAFTRFVYTTGMITIGGDIKFAEHIILHVIRMQDRPKNSATIARLINRDDIPNIQYSLRKLESIGLVEKVRDGKGNQFNYTVTELGEKVTDEYHDIKAHILIERLQEIQKAPEKLESMARFLSILTGVYEEAARDSATITPNSDA
ncbi:winged helix DNA-binding protein [Rhizorhabdus histidinilytica]|jgi:predicted MarR family transcription regulator|nr:winged helix DNA-binding protein [Rhizorhabdus histidinilytica]